MGLLYLDATGNYSDPTKTSYLYMRADGTWAKPDMAYRFRDAAGNWSVPELIPSQSQYSAMSWAQIQALGVKCAGAKGSGYDVMLGYTKPISVSGVGTVTTHLIGICHDTYTGGGTAGFTFQLCDGLSASAPTNFQMNTSDTNSGGWNASAMRTVNLPKLLAALPSDLRGLIKKVNKKTSTANSGTAVSTTSDDLFLLSFVESIGTNKTAYTDNPIASSNYLYNEGTQYEYYKLFDGNKANAFNAHIIKNASGSANTWWLRSIVLSSTSYFYRMASSGDWIYDSLASYSSLPAAGFCL